MDSRNVRAVGPGRPAPCWPQASCTCGWAPPPQRCRPPENPISELSQGMSGAGTLSYAACCHKCGPETCA
eukprot:scaffold13513_cov130-Isochrysis_galbana.AAC.4